MNPQTDTPESAELDKGYEVARYLIGAFDLSVDIEQFAHAIAQSNSAANPPLTAQQSDTALKLQRCEEALAQSENTLRSLIGTLQTVDSDDRYRARQERREPLVHTMEIKQAEQCRKQIALALTHPTRNEGACGDCDPCLGGRPDQCAIFPTRNEGEKKV